MPKVPKNFLDKMEKVIRRYHATTDEPLRGILSLRHLLELDK